MQNRTEVIVAQLGGRRAPLHLTPSEIDLFSELDWLGLPQFGSGFISNPDAAMRRKNVAADLEDELWPGLGNGIQLPMVDPNTHEIDVDMQDYHSQTLEEADSDSSLSVLLRAEYFERECGIMI